MFNNNSCDLPKIRLKRRSESKNRDMQNNKILKSFKNLANYNVKFRNENKKEINLLFLTNKLLAQQQELVKFYVLGTIKKCLEYNTFY